MLKMLPSCECCDRDLPADSTEAMICTNECTWCRVCAQDCLDHACPNCGGNLTPRPVRPPGLLAKYPASTERVHQPGLHRDHGSRPRPQVVSESLAELVDRARRLVADGTRRVLGITGTPGAGKSTLCAALLEALGEQAQLVGMDGFHLANQELARLGRSGRKGAPDTFDVDGYVALLQRLRVQKDDPIYGPVFDRGIEESIGSAVPVDPRTRLVITEGNYLLLADGGWERVRPCLDEVWYLDIDASLRDDRLVRRRQLFGHSLADSESWVTSVDQRNAAVVESTRGAADLVVRLT